MLRPRAEAITWMHSDLDLQCPSTSASLGAIGVADTNGRPEIFSLGLPRSALRMVKVVWSKLEAWKDDMRVITFGPIALL